MTADDPSVQSITGLLSGPRRSALEDELDEADEADEADDADDEGAEGEGSVERGEASAAANSDAARRVLESAAATEVTIITSTFISRQLVMT